MKVILEDELEKYAWGAMMEAYRSWIKHNGESLRDHMRIHLFTFQKRKVKRIIECEAKRRLVKEWGEDYINNLLLLSESEYVSKELKEHATKSLSKQNVESLKKTLKEGYAESRNLLNEEKMCHAMEAEDELIWICNDFLLAPWELTVVYGEVIQGCDVATEM